MTREELNKKAVEKLKTAIEVYERKPCEDCISRQAAIDAAMKNVSDIRTHDFNAGATKAANRIEELPTVQPARRKGKWITIKETIGDGFNGYDEIEFFECSLCHERQEYKFLFCPNCGADMREE